MTETIKVPEKNGAPPSNGLENGNGKRSATGLVIAGLVTVVGSWIGMAAYMDYRLQGMEERIATETKQQVVTEADTTRGALDARLKQLTSTMDTKINDTSSVLAKGLLNLTEKSDGYHTELMSSLTDGKTQLAKQMEEANQQSVTSLSNILNSLQKDVTQNVTSIQDQVTQLTTKVDTGNQQITQNIQTMGQTARESSEAVLAAAKNMENNLTEMNTGLITRMDSQTKSMEDLIKLSNSTAADKLSELAASMNAITSGSSNDSQKISADLAALAQQVTVLRNEIGASQGDVRALSASIPEWQKNSQQQLQTINDSAKSIGTNMQSHVDGLLSKIHDMNQQIDKTSESLMRALYITSEGMEGAKVELKSELESNKKATAQQIHELSQSMRDISQKLEGFKPQEGSQAASQSSFIPLNESPQFQTLANTLQGITSKTLDLRSQIDSQVNEVKVRTENMLTQSTQPEQAQLLQDMLHNFTSLADSAGGELDSLLENLQNLDQLMKKLPGEVKTAGEGATVSAPASDQEKKDSAEIGMKPE